MTPPALSLVIPAYNEEKRLPVALARIADWLGSRTPPLSAEVLVVDDDSSDRTAAVAEKTAAGLGLSFLVIRLPENRGKGAAVRAGVLRPRAWRWGTWTGLGRRKASSQPRVRQHTCMT